eukprot:7951067-Pyramimonas_sp.AAC.1
MQARRFGEGVACIHFLLATDRARITRTRWWKRGTTSKVERDYLQYPRGAGAAAMSPPTPEGSAAGFGPQGGQLDPRPQRYRTPRARARAGW